MSLNKILKRLFPTARRLLVGRYLRSLNLPKFNSVLVVGAGQDPYSKLFPYAKNYLRVDIMPVQGITDVVCDALAMPFGSEYFDCVFATELFEHLSNPFVFVAEIQRVLKPGGTVILTVPFLYHQHGDPYDYWRPTREALRQLFENFDEVSVISCGNRLHVISDLITTAFYPYQVFFPFRILNHILVHFPSVIFQKPSTAVSGHLLIAKKN